ncbi:NUDIX domain-containing protein [Apilactobacillus timberlakei]|uniref:NUDIX domain-containing protein n=1 Tax=Apilactobacillus timberlakei TaxID=2008380 RepID=UPI00112D7725|nr:NUDIX domain-containing protein [Apilactobacillus timberlakei]TPR19663.1 NUDIX domain-containing protein [Apilactobacillus timberlakei]TPR20640.1 NUDIX domain-containing protein [Apilactobacillus timberlakei]TPR22683.1 NUDIX domain-containing protein [Apilactobacillus timberlakei]
MEKEKNDIVIDENNKHFNYRSAGILQIENSFLFKQSVDKLADLEIIGGKVKFHESAYHAIIREFKEELGINIKVEKLFKVMDHEVKTANESWQQIIVIFKVSSSDLNVSKIPKEFSLHKKDELKHLNIQPNVFKNANSKIYMRDNF